MSKSMSESRKLELVNKAKAAGLNAEVFSQKGVQNRADFGGGATRKQEKICKIDGKYYSAAALKVKIASTLNRAAIK